MAQIINATIKRKEIFEELEYEGDGPTLEQMQKIVGGNIEVVTLSDGECLVINEDGKGLGLEMNPYATMAAYGFISEDDRIVGPAIFLEPGEIV